MFFLVRQDREYSVEEDPLGLLERPDGVARPFWPMVASVGGSLAFVVGLFVGMPALEKWSAERDAERALRKELAGTKNELKIGGTRGCQVTPEFRRRVEERVAERDGDPFVYIDFTSSSQPDCDLLDRYGIGWEAYKRRREQGTACELNTEFVDLDGFEGRIWGVDGRCKLRYPGL